VYDETAHGRPGVQGCRGDRGDATSRNTTAAASTATGAAKCEGVERKNWGVVSVLPCAIMPPRPAIMPPLRCCAGGGAAAGMTGQLVNSCDLKL
jgi:hypothetical protein